MWWLALGGVALLIYAGVKNEEREARQRWEQKWESVQQTVEEHRKNIEECIEQARVSYDFRLLTSVHYSSVKVADTAYSALKDARVSLEAVSKLLVATKSRLQELKDELHKERDLNRKTELKEEIRLIQEQRKSFFDDKDKVKKQRDELHNQVKNLNQQTRMLKLAIRDRCGLQGLEWYERLEKRIKEKRPLKHE